MTTEAGNEQIYRLRAPASGREAITAVRDGSVYLDAETGEELEPVAAILPLSGEGESLLPRSPLNLRVCRRCDQLTARDLNACEYCGHPAA